MTQSEPPQGQPPGQDQGDIWQGARPTPEGAPDAGTPQAPGQPPAPGEPPRAAGGQSPAWTQTLTSTAPSPGPAGFYYADVPNRVIAYIVDAIILYIIGALLLFLLSQITGGITTEPGFPDDGELNVGAFLVQSIAQLALSFAYFGYFWTAMRGTPGMKLLGLQIGDEVDGRSITWNQAVIRWLIIGIPSILVTLAALGSAALVLVLAVVGIGWLFILLYTIAQSPTKQGLHDRYARTIMVKAGRRAA